jgi:hypothetical protein
MCQALAVRRDHVERVAQVVEGERLHPLRLIGRQVGHPEVSTLFGYERVQTVSHVPPVEAGCSLCGDPLEGLRQGRVLEQAAHGRRLALGSVQGHGGLVQHRGAGRDVPSQPLRDGKAVSGVVDGGRQELGQGQGTVPLMGRDPATNGARHADGHGTPLRYGRLAGLGEERGCGQRSSGSAGIEPRDPAAFGLVEEGERVPAHAVHVGPNDGQDASHGQGRIDRAAAPLQHGHTGPSRQWVSRGNGAMGAADVRPVGGRKLRGLEASLVPLGHGGLRRASPRHGTRRRERQ